MNHYKQALKPLLWERVQGQGFYIGTHLAGTFIGDRELGYIHRSTMYGGHGYSRSFTSTIRILRKQYWYGKFATTKHMGLD